MTLIKTYRELCRLHTFEDRFSYLKLDGRMSFGADRYLNQLLYRSPEWQSIRDKVAIRDDGCDLGISDHEIFARITIHHINPISILDIEERRDCVFDLNNLICTSQETHNAIHYGDESLLVRLPKERTKGDTCPWRN